MGSSHLDRLAQQVQEALTAALNPALPMAWRQVATRDAYRFAVQLGREGQRVLLQRELAETLRTAGPGKPRRQETDWALYLPERPHYTGD